MLHSLTWNLLGNILFEFSSLFKAFRWWEVKDRKCVVTADVGDAGFLSVACHHQNTRERLEVQGKKKKITLKTSRMKVNNYGSLWEKCKGIPSFTHRHHHHHHCHRPHHHHHLLHHHQHHQHLLPLLPRLHHHHRPPPQIQMVWVPPFSVGLFYSAF